MTRDTTGQARHRGMTLRIGAPSRSKYTVANGVIVQYNRGVPVNVSEGDLR